MSASAVARPGVIGSLRLAMKRAEATGEPRPIVSIVSADATLKRIREMTTDRVQIETSMAALDEEWRALKEQYELDKSDIQGELDAIDGRLREQREVVAGICRDHGIKAEV